MMNHQINIGFETEVADENSVREPDPHLARSVC